MFPDEESQRRSAVNVVKPNIASFVVNDSKAFQVIASTGRGNVTVAGSLNDQVTPSDRKLVQAWNTFQTALVQYVSDQLAYLPPATPDPSA